MEPYKVALIQQETKVIVNPSERDGIIEQNLDRIFELIQWTFNRVGEVRLAAIETTRPIWSITCELPRYPFLGRSDPKNAPAHTDKKYARFS